MSCNSIEFDALFESEEEGKRSYKEKRLLVLRESLFLEKERERERKKEKGKREGFLRSTKKETRGRSRRVKKRESDRAMSYGGNATPSMALCTTEGR